MILTNEMIDVIKRRKAAVLKGKLKIAKERNDTQKIKGLRKELRKLNKSYIVARMMGRKNFEQAVFFINHKNKSANN